MEIDKLGPKFKYRSKQYIRTMVHNNNHTKKHQKSSQSPETQKPTKSTQETRKNQNNKQTQTKATETFRRKSSI